MTTDRELLELAAKAAGYEFRFSPDWHDTDEPQVKVTRGRYTDWAAWNSLAYDDDALRLAVKARVFLDDELRDRFAYLYGTELVNHGPEEATRRAITRVVVEAQEAKETP